LAQAFSPLLWKNGEFDKVSDKVSDKGCDEGLKPAGVKRANGGGFHLGFEQGY
jgi:hypothetical protein